MGIAMLRRRAVLAGTVGILSIFPGVHGMEVRRRLNGVDVPPDDIEDHNFHGTACQLSFVDESTRERVIRDFPNVSAMVHKLGKIFRLKLLNGRRVTSLTMTLLDEVLSYH